MKLIRLDPRLCAVAEMVNAEIAADIGCDHGRLAVALLQRGRAQRALCSDISAPSLEKARALAALCGMSERMEFRVANGLEGLSPGRADTLIFAGMGGRLTADLLAAAPDVAACRLVMQPMTGASTLRRYLYEHGYEIYDEALAAESWRIYQIIAARPGAPRPLPPGFPEDFYTFGALSLEKRDPLLPRLVAQYQRGHLARMERARQSGVSPEALEDILEKTERLTELIRRYYK